MRILLGLISITTLVACGDDGGSGGGDGGPKDSGNGDGSPIDGTIDASIDAMIDAPAGTTPLKVKNYLAWCTVSVNGATESIASVQDANVTPGDITLVARGRGTVQTPTFIVAGNMWHRTDGDTGNGETGVVSAGVDPTKTSTAHVTVGSTAACVWVCCPFPDGHGCEFPGTVSEQCP